MGFQEDLGIAAMVGSEPRPQGKGSHKKRRPRSVRPARCKERRPQHGSQGLTSNQMKFNSILPHLLTDRLKLAQRSLVSSSQRPKSPKFCFPRTNGNAEETRLRETSLVRKWDGDSFI
jgi:hypothetical protein